MFFIVFWQISIILSYIILYYPTVYYPIFSYIILYHPIFACLVDVSWCIFLWHFRIPIDFVPWIIWIIWIQAGVNFYTQLKTVTSAWRDDGHWLRAGPVEGRHGNVMHTAPDFFEKIHFQIFSECWYFCFSRIAFDGCCMLLQCEDNNAVVIRLEADCKAFFHILSTFIRRDMAMTLDAIPFKDIQSLPHYCNILTVIWQCVKTLYPWWTSK